MSAKNRNNKKQNIKKKDLVSVITTFYNAQTFILNAVNSVMQQVCTDDYSIEYIIVDDKSPDNSRTIIENFLKQNQYIY